MLCSGNHTVLQSNILFSQGKTEVGFQTVQIVRKSTPQFTRGKRHKQCFRFFNIVSVIPSPGIQFKLGNLLTVFQVAAHIVTLIGIAIVGNEGSFNR